MCLDFINTLDDRFTNQPKELLQHYIDLVRFAEDAGILHTLHVDQLIERGYTSAEAQQVLGEAIELREAMYAVFWAIVNKKSVPKLPLHTLNNYVQIAARHSSLVQVNGKFEWHFDEIPLQFEMPLWPIARSAAEVLASDQLPYVRACGSKTCQWLFLDTSKNHRRRWCDMTKCGNRAKARSYYARQHRSRSSGKRA